ncbi:GTPase HflX [Lysinibacillus sphaericus]
MDKLKEVDVLLEKAILVGVNLRNDKHFEYSMEELTNLAEALNVEVVGIVTQNLERVTPSHYVGTGKIEEIKSFYEEAQANLVIFNDELSPSQIRNLERDLETKVIDRTMLILDIFGRRAKTREAQMQVELAQLQYMLPRLVGDAGFSIFYMGINMGAFIAPFIVGTIGQKYSFHLGFSLAAVGMLIGLIVFKVTEKKYLGLAGLQVNNPLKPEERKKVFTQIAIVALVILVLGGIGIKTGVLTMNVFSLLITILGVLIPTAFFIYMYRSEKTTKDEKSRLLAYIPLFLAAVMFWAIQEQGATILATYADERTQLNLGGFQLESSWFQSLNPLFVITLSPLFAMLWLKWGDKQPSTPRKFSYSLFFAGLSFLVMMIPAHLSGGQALVSPLWLVLSFFLVVVGELLLSPVGLSATTKLAPQAFAAQTMSLWFLTSAAAQAINAQLVKVYEVVSEFTYFGFLGSLSILIGILLLVLSPIISKAMRGIN